MRTAILIGDSIRMGYEPCVREALEGTADVTGPAENGGTSANVLAHLDEWALSRGADVVHVNCGLHDIKRERGGTGTATPLDEYRANMRRVVPSQVGLYTAAGLLRLASDPFRNREPNWADRTEAILERAEDILDSQVRQRDDRTATTVVTAELPSTANEDHVECPCCGGTFEGFGQYGLTPRKNARCPDCGAKERHRLLWLYLKNRTNLFADKLKVLHFAPEQSFGKTLAAQPNLEYVSADLSSGRAMVKADITGTPFPSNAFDVVLCSHVLEHVPDDGAAMREVYRMLKPGGWAILQIPIDLNREKTYEDERITSPEERERAFGQHDHVRVYGRDYKRRLQNAGFEVRVDHYARDLGAYMTNRYGLKKRTGIYVCVKPKSRQAKPLRVPVTDPYGITRDATLQLREEALDPNEVQQRISGLLPNWMREQGPVTLNAIRVARHKPGRRCLIEYNFEQQRTEKPNSTVTLIGKVRAKGLDQSTYETVKSLQWAGFDNESEDGISVPTPIGLLPDWNMWVRRKVPGVTATRLLAEPEGVTLARRIAEAVNKLHNAGVRSHRRHTMDDELAILHHRLPKVSKERPQLADRIEAVLDACDQLGADTSEPHECWIHRDLYADQILVDGRRLYLLDFDQYCQGDPALDIGNFRAHIIEQSLRMLGRADALADREAALQERYLQLADDVDEASIEAYTTLTLVRHIYLSTQYPKRRHVTGALLELCEQRLGLVERRVSDDSRYSMMAMT